MHFLATFHNMATWHSCWHNAYDYDAKGGKFVEIYNEPHKKGDPIPRSYLDRQVGFVKEVVERYQPDGIWFDYGLYNALYKAGVILSEIYTRFAETDGEEREIEIRLPAMPGLAGIEELVMLCGSNEQRASMDISLSGLEFEPVGKGQK
jgi:hypothetical protein